MKLKINWQVLTKKELIETTWEFLYTMNYYETMDSLCWDIWNHIYNKYNVTVNITYIKSIIKNFII